MKIKNIRHLKHYLWSLFDCCLAVNQEYSTKAEDEYVIQGNDVLVKCKIPSFVADFVSVVGWIDDKSKPLDANILNHYSTS